MVVTPDKEQSFRRRLAQLHESVQRRAYEIYRQRHHPAAAGDDWRCAEKETMLCALAGIESDSGRVRITAAVHDLDPRELLVEVLPDTILVEADPAKEHKSPHYSVFPLREKINPFLAKATFEQGQITVTAPTTGALRENRQ